MGSVKIRGSFFDSQETFKTGKAENCDEYCSATTEYGIIITPSVGVWSVTVQPATVLFQSISVGQTVGSDLILG